MTEISRLVSIDSKEGSSWFSKSLNGGIEISDEVLASTSFDRGYFYTFVSRDVALDQVQFPNYPDVSGSNAGLAKYLDELTRYGASCLVIEDEVALRKDPGLSEWAVPSAFFGDRVVHWWDLKPDSGEDAVGAIHASAFGYPLNAFVVTRYAADLGLVDGHPAPDGLPKDVASSLQAIIVSAFDATSFAIWDRRKSKVGT